MANIDLPSDEKLGKMLEDAGNLMADSGRKAIAKDWPNAAIASMQANQLTARVIRIMAIRDKAQTNSIAKLKAEIADLEARLDTAERSTANVG